jgi:hypothetical protein
MSCASFVTINRMMNIFLKAVRYIRNTTSGKKVLMFLVPALGVYLTMLSYSIPRVLEYSGGMKILDLIPTGYNTEYAQKLFETLGETGRDIYLFQQIPLDMIYPGLFAVSFSLLLAFLFKKAFSATSKIQNLVVVPVFAGLFDYLENIGIIIMLTSYPDFYAWVVSVTNIFSISKSLLTTLVFALNIISLVRIFGRKIFKQ